MTTDDHIAWDEALLAGRPDPLLHWFATECALRAIEREQQRRGALSPEFGRLVELVVRLKSAWAEHGPSMPKALLVDG